jgi:hypothetical protein
MDALQFAGTILMAAIGLRIVFFIYNQFAGRKKKKSVHSYFDDEI